MFTVVRILKRSIIAFVLIVLSVVLFPGQTEPLYSWGKSTGSALGLESIPSFNTAQGFAGMSLLIATLGTIVYTLWRDRRYEVLRAEYNHNTGANHLRLKVRELEDQLARVQEEKEELNLSYMNLNKQHTAALIAAKEYEIHHKYGQEDRAMLKELRTQFENVLREKRDSNSFREAVELMMNMLPMPNNPPEVSLATPPNGNGRDPLKNRGALSFQK